MTTRVVIVDDSVLFRHLLSEIIADLPNVTVAATAPNGAIALKKIVHTPCEAVFLDIEMPEMDGIETLKHLRAEHPDINVVMISGCTREATKNTVTALKMGALEFINKPSTEDKDANRKQLTFEIKAVLRIIETRNLLRNTRKQPVEDKKEKPEITPALQRHYPMPKVKSFGIVCIGVSTGGPNALITLVSGLPVNFSVPIVVVQHMPPNFTRALAEDLNKRSALHVIEAREGLPALPGTMIIAKGGHHMVLRKKEEHTVVALNDSPPENSCKPSVDVLFRSVASYYGKRGVLSLIMTGMGADGLAGVRTLKRHSCYSITQSEASCVVYGMPRAVDEAGLSDESVPLDELSNRLVMLTNSLPMK